VRVQTPAIPDVSTAQSPGVAYALIIGSVLIALVPVLLAVLKGRHTSDGGTKPPDSSASASSPLPAAVERGTDLAERYFASLETRAERAEQLLEQTRAQLVESDRRHAADSLEWQRKLDGAQAEIAQLRSQIDRLVWREQGGGSA
jgi:hypothetical protein